MVPNRLVGLFVPAVVAVMLIGGATQLDGSRAAASATPAPCPVTQPNGYVPPEGEEALGEDPGGYGNSELWTNVWMWGEGKVLVPPDHVGADGSLGEMKWAWWRGVPGELTIEGHRLDAPAPPLLAWIPDGYGERGFQVSGLTFPTVGCWEVTGRVGEASLTFVVRVARVNLAGTPIA